VECIHWVDRDELPVLEHVMKSMGRISTGTMNSHQHNTLNMFATAETFKAKKAEARIARRSWTEVRVHELAECGAWGPAPGCARFLELQARQGHALRHAVACTLLTVRPGTQVPNHTVSMDKQRFVCMYLLNALHCAGVHAHQGAGGRDGARQVANRARRVIAARH
jgi:hypothetical protein